MKQQMNAMKEKLFAQEGELAFRLSTFTLNVEQFLEKTPNPEKLERLLPKIVALRSSDMMQTASGAEITYLDTLLLLVKDFLEKNLRKTNATES